jgi:(E)-4-hydroxy-3-methylbut-2-enyl-diphosphate synthase
LGGSRKREEGMMKRRKTRTVNVGGVKVGSGNPVSIQSMTKTDTCDVDSTVGQIDLLEKAGCDIVRVAVKDIDAARAIRDIKKGIHIPLVADIHFDHKLALEAVKSGADKIRINPGNITRSADIDSVIDAAAEKGISIRIGVNSGSLMDDVDVGSDASAAMVKGVLKYLERFRKKKFDDIVISLKSSDVPTTVKAYRIMAEKCDYPFHVGVTAAGSSQIGIIKGAMGIGALLLD